MFYYVWGWGEIIHCVKWLCQLCCKLSFCCSAINSAHNTCENHHAPFRGGKSLKKSILVNKPFLMALWISGREHNSWFTLLTKSASLFPANKTRLHVRKGWAHWYRNRGVGVSLRKTQPKLHFLLNHLLGMAQMLTAAQISDVDTIISLPALTTGSAVLSATWQTQQMYFPKLEILEDNNFTACMQPLSVLLRKAYVSLECSLLKFKHIFLSCPPRVWRTNYSHLYPPQSAFECPRQGQCDC